MLSHGRQVVGSALPHLGWTHPHPITVQFGLGSGPSFWSAVPDKRWGQLSRVLQPVMSRVGSIYSLDIQLVPNSYSRVI